MENEKLNKEMLEKIASAVAVTVVNAVCRYMEERRAEKKKEQNSS